MITAGIFGRPASLERSWDIWSTGIFFPSSPRQKRRVKTAGREQMTISWTSTRWLPSVRERCGRCPPYEVGKKVRKTIEEIGGPMPECLPAFESIKLAEKKQRGKLKH